MAQKNKVKVMIEGKMITLGGYESQEYLEHVAFYVNKKIAELSELPGYSRQTDHMKSILLALNVTDDYFKAKSRAEHLETDLEEKDENTYEIRQDLVNAQIKIQELTEEIARLKGQAGMPAFGKAHASSASAPETDDYYLDDEDEFVSDADQTYTAVDVNSDIKKNHRSSKRYVKNRN